MLLELHMLPHAEVDPLGPRFEERRLHNEPVRCQHPRCVTPPILTTLAAGGPRVQAVPPSATEAVRCVRWPFHRGEGVLQRSEVHEHP